MKIVHVVYSLEMGGAEVLVGQLCRIQRTEGHDVSVCAYARMGSVGEALAAEGFAIHVPGEAHPIVTMARYLKHFRALRPDVVHCHNPAPTLQAALSAKLAGVKRVLSTRHSLVAPPYNVPAEVKYGIMATFCDFIVGICEITCANLRNAPLAHRNKIVRVYNGASAIERVPAEDKRGCTLVFLGRLAAIKDLGTLIRAVALALPHMPGLEAWIVGDGPVRAELEELAKSLGLEETVRFWGQRMDTARFFSAADVFCMSSVSEGLPMSLVQAMSLGVPALLTDVGGMAEVVGMADCGLLVPVGDSVAMADAIVRLAGNVELRKSLGENGRAAYEREFTLEQMASGYMKLYQM